jgi:heme/copper-type cytochrome/quinol oxidase subunit 2
MEQVVFLIYIMTIIINNIVCVCVCMYVCVCVCVCVCVYRVCIRRQSTTTSSVGSSNRLLVPTVNSYLVLINLELEQMIAYYSYYDSSYQPKPSTLNPEPSTLIPKPYP